ncbi:hypothetical protein EI94DRAFT_1725610 [Lactarius quietus]|nr:hypothetical protein EI94DRAFT_1725610 [Lactarius quietus]
MEDTSLREGRPKHFWGVGSRTLKRDNKSRMVLIWTKSGWRKNRLRIGSRNSKTQPVLTALFITKVTPHFKYTAGLLKVRAGLYSRIVICAWQLRTLPSKPTFIQQQPSKPPQRVLLMFIEGPHASEIHEYTGKSVRHQARYRIAIHVLAVECSPQTWHLLPTMAHFKLHEPWLQVVSCQ